MLAETNSAAAATVASNLPLILPSTLSVGERFEQDRSTIHFLCIIIKFRRNDAEDVTTKALPLGGVLIKRYLQIVIFQFYYYGDRFGRSVTVFGCLLWPVICVACCHQQ